MAFISKEERAKLKKSESNAGNVVTANKEVSNNDSPNVLRGETSENLIIQADGAKKESERSFSCKISSVIYDKMLDYQKTEAKKFETQKYILEHALVDYMVKNGFLEKDFAH